MAISKLNPVEGGIPKGNTANRSVEFPSPQIGDVYYNGQLEVLEIYNGTSWVAVSAPPATPNITSVTDVGAGLAYETGGTFTVVLSPGSGGSTASQFNVSTTTGGFSSSSSGTTLSLTGLTPGTSFVVVANAQNNFGTTVNSSPFSSITATTVPQAPTIGTATISNGLPVVSWTLGNNGGKNLTSITITPYLNGTTAQTPRTAATTNSTSYAFTTGQLTEDASYTFKVKATNANGDSLESSASNSVTVNEIFTIETLVVAGGGGGGANGNTTGGGGGGAGGYLYNSSTSIYAGSYTITVGAKGIGVNRTSGSHSTPISGSKGGDSSITGSNFTSIIATGGGGGVSNQSGGTPSSSNGGSGGGGNYINAAGTGTSGQGNNGGQAWQYQSGANELAFAGGGGGGSSAVGGNATNTVGGSGGAGTANSITGSSLVYAAGGGAGARGSYTAGTGGSSIGGNGVAGDGVGGSASPANRGSGGGGGGGNGDNPSYKGGDGSDGVVIIAYASSLPALTIGAGLTYDQPTRSGYRVYRFTAGTGTVTF